MRYFLIYGISKDLYNSFLLTKTCSYILLFFKESHTNIKKEWKFFT